MLSLGYDYLIKSAVTQKYIERKKDETKYSTSKSCQKRR